MVQQAAPSGSPEAAALQPLLAQCLAAEIELPRSRGGQLLAWVPGTQQLLAAAGTHLLLLQPTPAGMTPLAALLETQTSISAVAVSSCGDGEPQQWAAALAGSTAHLLPLSVGALGGREGGREGGSDAGIGGSSSGSCSFEAPGAACAWQACAWHPTLPVCALAAPGHLLVVSAAGSGSDRHSRSSSSSCGASETRKESPQTAAEGDGGSGSAGNGRVLATLAAGAADAAPRRICLAWLDGSGSGGSGGGGCCKRLVAGWGAQLELFEFGSGWQLLARRELLAGLPGPICGLAAAGNDAVLVTTERPVGSWLGSSAHPEQQQQQQGVALEVEDGCASSQALLRGLQQAALRRQQALLLPGTLGSAGGSPSLAQAAQQPSSQSPPTAGSSGGLIDLTRRSFTPSARAPSIPSGLLLPSMALRDQDQAPLGEGLPTLPLARPLPEQEGGRATLLWLGAGCSAPGNTTQDARSAAHSSGRVSPAGAAAAPLPTGSPPAAPETAAQPLGLAPDLVQLLDGHAVLGSSSATPPAVALCRLGPYQLHLLCGAAPLTLPDGIRDGSSVRLRGLAVLPAALSPTTGSDDSTNAAAAAAAGAAAGQPLLLALFTAASKPAAAPFLGAALASSRQQQAWLCCYSLEQLLQRSTGTAGQVPVAALGGAATVADGDGDRIGPAAAELAVERQQHVQGRVDAVVFGGAPAAGSSATAEAAVLALQAEVAALRRDVNGRLDRIEAQLNQLLQALGQPP
ncbi:hypothetical protein ABPG75_008596 [Micractinium tetrahymenae]